jgi:hypothetical protein
LISYFILLTGHSRQPAVRQEKGRGKIFNPPPLVSPPAPPLFRRVYDGAERGGFTLFAIPIFNLVFGLVFGLIVWMIQHFFPLPCLGIWASAIYSLRAEMCATIRLSDLSFPTLLSVTPKTIENHLHFLSNTFQKFTNTNKKHITHFTNSQTLIQSFCQTLGIFEFLKPRAIRGP